MKKNHNKSSKLDYRRIFESASTLFIILDKQFKIVDVNQSFLKATMVERDNVIGCGVFDVFPDNPDDPHANGVSIISASLERVLRNKITETIAVQKYDIQRPAIFGGGFEERYWSSVSSPIIDSNGEVEYIIIAVEDVTDFALRKQVESEQEKLTKAWRTRAKKMEAEIFKRAQEIQEINSKLAASKEYSERMAIRAETSNRLKSEFLANMSHELRTPLNAIIGFAELMYNNQLGPVSDENKEYLGDILTSSKHLLQLINDVLDLSKIESGKMIFYPEVINIMQLISEVSHILNAIMTQKKLHLTIEIDSSLKSIVIDPAKLKQVIYNYLSNAIKFTHEFGHITIRVLPYEQQYFRIEVIDDGIGIHEDDINKLFIEFQQLNIGVTKQHSGTGLGLALTKRIVEAQGGEVGVKSSLGKGSMFYAILPLIFRG